ncbi:hypothetical protein [uncultured Pseudokineococcus sp.]|uniref:hypothetical protein n=1 Tax=uncultured Pseudokineococcus sp. TaxID=1642928 RepID=UPI00342E551D
MLDGRPWVWDTSPLLHAARAERLDVVAFLAGQRSSDHRTTSVVRSELDRGGVLGEVLRLGWPVSEGDREDSEWLARVAEWEVPLGVRGLHNLGEATCFALATSIDGVVVVDDKAAARAAEKRGLAKIGLLGVLDDAERLGHQTMTQAVAVVHALAETDGRYPRDAVADFPAWCRLRRRKLHLT